MQYAVDKLHRACLVRKYLLTTSNVAYFMYFTMLIKEIAIMVKQPCYIHQPVHDALSSQCSRGCQAVVYK